MSKVERELLRLAIRSLGHGPHYSYEWVYPMITRTLSLNQCKSPRITNSQIGNEDDFNEYFAL